MKNNIQISFIVPAYNMEGYLKDALDSILTLTNVTYEVIIVDDGSTDNTFLIADSYVKNHSNFKLIHKENEGISQARNAGLKEAKGDYVCFLDSDDFYIVDFASTFYKLCIENDLDIIRGLYKIYNDDTKEYNEYNTPKVDFYNIALSGKEFLNLSIKYKTNEVVPWLGFFKRDYLLKNKLLFPKGIAYEEDQIFFLQALLCNDNCKAMQTDIVFYSYRYRNNSVTKTPTLKQAQDVVSVVNLEHEFIENLSNLDKFTKKSAYRYSCSSFYQLTSIYGRVIKANKKPIKKLASFKLVNKCLKYPYNKHQFIKIAMFKYTPCLVDLIYKIKLK